MRRIIGGRSVATGALAALLVHVAVPLAAAMQILEATDHGELAAEVSASEVSRIALVGDRIARVIRSPGGFTVEHDPARGDLYLRPDDRGIDEAGPAAPVALFVGSERGFTYRLVLTPAEGGSAQILIRNPDVAGGSAVEARIDALVRIVSAVARREPLPGHVIETGGTAGGLEVLEAWRGPRFTALVLKLEPDRPSGAAALASRLGPGIAAAWVAPRGPSGARIAVAVRENASDRDPGESGGPR